MIQAAIFGDSLMRGMYWNEQLAKHKLWKNPFLPQIAADCGVELENHSFIGSTVRRGLAAFERMLKKGLHCELLLLEYGGNDADFDWPKIAAAPQEQHQPKTPLPLFEQLYGKLITLGRSLGMQPVLMNLPPVDAQKYFRWFSRELDKRALRRWLGNIDIIYRHQEAYSLACTALARQYDCPLIDLRTPFLLRHDLDQLICADGLHPTPAGYELIWQQLTAFFLKFR